MTISLGDVETTALIPVALVTAPRVLKAGKLPHPKK